MIALFSDFSFNDPYVGLMKLEIYKRAPACTIIDICHDLPAFNPNAAGRLLQMLVKDLPKNTIVLAIVDPGVGTERNALWLEIDGRHFIGPDNGLFARIVNESNQTKAHIINYDVNKVSASFHGRDVFAPVAAAIANGNQIDAESYDDRILIGLEWPQELFEIIYIDQFGNSMTGIIAKQITRDASFRIKGKKLYYARTFLQAKNTVFWFENSLGLVEIASKQLNAAKKLELVIGDKVNIN